MQWNVFAAFAMEPSSFQVLIQLQQSFGAHCSNNLSIANGIVAFSDRLVR